MVDDMQHLRINGFLKITGMVFSVFVFFFWLWVLPAGAVDKGRTSYTAESVCAFRAIAAQDPDPKTRNPDHMAKYFVNPALKHRFPGLGLDYEDAKIAMDGMRTGVLYWVNARTHHMDTKLIEALKDGFQQVLVMGAGFDSRAYRFHEAYPGVRFFEVDLPATSKDKQARVEKILGHRPDWVTYVPIDFNTQALEDVLPKAGFDLALKTFYIWEGVTYYISQAGVEGTLQFVAEKSAPGSQIVFDYMLEDVVNGSDYSPYGAKFTVFMISNSGEPYVYGIDPNKLEAYINHFGLALLSNIGPSELTQNYLIHTNGAISGKIAEFLHIAHARVPLKAQSDPFRHTIDAPSTHAVSKKKEPLIHRVDVPEDIQAFLSAHSRNLKSKDFDKIREQHSDNFLAYGHNKQQTMGVLRQVYKDRPIHRYVVVLTRFERNGNRAKIDGYVQRKGFRTPLMISDLIKESDHKWRWYGDQRR